MQLLKKYLNEHNFILKCCAIALVLQVAFSLVMPFLMGNFINIGIQQKGVNESVPQVMTDEAMNLFEKVLPEHIFTEFSSCYTFCEEAPDECDKYISTLKNRYFLKAEHKEQARYIYENTLVSALIFAQDTFNEIENIDFNALYEFVSLKFLYEKLEDKTISPSDAEYYYNRTNEISPAVKKQIASMIIPYIYEDAGVDIEETELNYIIHSAIFMIICTTGQLACMIFVHIKASFVSAEIENTLRKKLLQHTAEFGKREFRKHSPEKINAIVNSDINRVGMTVNYLLKLFMYAPLLALGGTIISLCKNLFMGFLILITAIVIVAALTIIFKLTEKKYELMNNIYDKLAKFFKVSVEQILTIRATGMEQTEAEKVNKASADYQKNENFVMRSVFIGTAMINLITNAIIAIMVLVGGNNLLNSSLSLGDMVAFLQYALLTISAFMMIGALFLFFPKAMISMKNIDSILSEEIHRTTNGKITELEKIADIRFENVRLEEVPNAEFNFTIPQGTKIGITGCTGCGKTTLMELLLLRSSPLSGNIYIGDTPICNIDAELLRKKISYAQSSSILFTKTLRENLMLYGCENNEQKMMTALKNAQCDFLPKQPLDRIIMNAGANFSGGQKSRIAIAGALGKDADLYIFDDCFTALDSDTEEKILNKLIEEKSDATIIIISQRIKSIMNCDKIIVLSENGVQAEGTHSQLLEKSAYYHRISQNQLNEVTANG